MDTQRTCLGGQGRRLGPPQYSPVWRERNVGVTRGAVAGGEHLRHRCAGLKSGNSEPELMFGIIASVEGDCGVRDVG